VDNCGWLVIPCDVSPPPAPSYGLIYSLARLEGVSGLIFVYLFPIGGGAFVAALAGMIEGADNGLLIGRGVLGIISFIASLIVSGAFISFAAFLLGIKVAAFFYDKRDGSSP
jgi:hypothetical protein